MKPVHKSNKLANVCYDIRGPVLQQAKKMEDEGQKIIKLNIGNLGVFGFDSPEEIQLDMIRNLPNAAGYSDSKGIFAARKAVMHYTQEKRIKGVTLEDIYIGNGASELIVMSLNALLDAGDEVIGYETNGGYDPMQIFNNDPDIRRVLMQLINGEYDSNPELFRDLRPGEHGGGRRRHFEAGLAEALDHDVATALVDGAHLVDAIVGSVERGRGRDLDRRKGTVIEVGFDPRQRGDQPLVADGKAHAPAGHREGLRHRGELDADVHGARHLQH